MHRLQFFQKLPTLATRQQAGKVPFALMNDPNQPVFRSVDQGAADVNTVVQIRLFKQLVLIQAIDREAWYHSSLYCF